MLCGRFGEQTVPCYCLCTRAGELSRHSTAPGWGHQAAPDMLAEWHSQIKERSLQCVFVKGYWPNTAIQMLRWNFWWCLLYTGQSVGLNLQVALSNTSVADWVEYICLQDGQLCCKDVEFTVAFFKKMLKYQKIHVLAAAWYLESQKDWLCLR